MKYKVKILQKNKVIKKEKVNVDNPEQLTEMVHTFFNTYANNWNYRTIKVLAKRSK